MSQTKPREECSYQEIYPGLGSSTRLKVHVVRTTTTVNGTNGPTDTNDSSTQNAQTVQDTQAGPVVGGKGFRPCPRPLATDNVNPVYTSVGYQGTQGGFEMPLEYIRSHPSPCDPGVEALTRSIPKGSNAPVKVEYDMDQQDDRFLEHLNSSRPQSGQITKELFEVTMTLFELEWYFIDRKMPPKKKTSVEGEIADNDEQRCTVCDEAECNNSNAIVFCDGCDIAVHQDCYGIPFIPEGQWLCSQCTISRKRKASCIFCPNKSGALKMTDTRRWAHVLCALWIPEVLVLRPIYMEPIGGIDRIPKSRWKLVCYVCRYKIGACIQCANKSCFQAFHPTCGRKARLYMKMTAGPHGALNDPGTLLAYCDKHTPYDYAQEVDVVGGLKTAQAHYESLRPQHQYTGNEWQSNLFPDDTVVAETKFIRKVHDKSKIWRTEQGTPAPPQVMVDKIHRVVLGKPGLIVPDLQDYLYAMARYWTLKRQLKRGAYLIKRFQLALEMEPNVVLPKDETAEKVALYEDLVDRLKQLSAIVGLVKQREETKLELCDNQHRQAQIVYFTAQSLVTPLTEKIKEEANPDLADVCAQLKSYYPSVQALKDNFAQICDQMAHENGASVARQISKLRRSVDPLIEESLAKEQQFNYDETTGLADFRNFLPDGLSIQDEVWTGARIRREESPLTDEEELEAQLNAREEPAIATKRKRSDGPSPTTTATMPSATKPIQPNGHANSRPRSRLRRRR